MKELVIIQTAVPDYRKRLFQYLKSKLGDNFILYGGEKYFEESVKTDYSMGFIKTVENHFLLNNKALIQTGMWSEALKCEILVLEMNPRIVSNWILLTVRNLFGKKTILWGHAWPRLGKDSKSDRIRHIMRILAHQIIVYTKTQKVELEIKMPSKNIKAASNALYYKEEIQFIKTNASEINNLIYVGRLTELKKPLLLVQAFANSLERIPSNASLIIIGEGGEKRKIIDYIRNYKLEDRIQLLGHIDDYKSLRKLYSKCLFSVSPGYVGLSVIQSFCFGVPMLVSKNENHSPEIEAVKESENSLFFETNNINDLSLKISDIYLNKNHWINKRDVISQNCKDNYSIEEMGKKFLEICN